jgi:hypothetical protein
MTQENMEGQEVTGSAPDYHNEVRVSSRWKHRNGNIYTVTMLANTDSTRQDDYPVMVVYRGENGKIWCRAFSDWHRSMTLIDELPN